MYKSLFASVVQNTEPFYDILSHSGMYNYGTNNTAGLWKVNVHSTALKAAEII